MKRQHTNGKSPEYYETVIEETMTRSIRKLEVLVKTLHAAVRLQTHTVKTVKRINNIAEQSFLTSNSLEQSVNKLLVDSILNTRGPC